MLAVLWESYWRGIRTSWLLPYCRPLRSDVWGIGRRIGWPCRTCRGPLSGVEVTCLVNPLDCAVQVHSDYDYVYDVTNNQQKGESSLCRSACNLFRFFRYSRSLDNSSHCYLDRAYSCFTRYWDTNSYTSTCFFNNYRDAFYGSLWVVSADVVCLEDC